MCNAVDPIFEPYTYDLTTILTRTQEINSFDPKKPDVMVSNLSVLSFECIIK